jgi:hypothetical protein
MQLIVFAQALQLLQCLAETLHSISFVASSHGVEPSAGRPEVATVAACRAACDASAVEQNTRSAQAAAAQRGRAARDACTNHDDVRRRGQVGCRAEGVQVVCFGQKSSAHAHFIHDLLKGKKKTIPGMHLFKILMDLKKIVLVLKYLERKAEGENYHWKD